ncbi:hypothetical protein CERSUDRAFT_95783 [Gelatoporia subvermispora B]|uniref:Uncharacterized protein n=1 Tax=Ceriporiopsis subvermispora (strain B) TaxID=914234 RepID=M2RDH6_CERS8|nr:hypothetical protein CERSUDRAFT_95783 [Gelatoporia subvermispora B]
MENEELLAKVDELTRLAAQTTDKKEELANKARTQVLEERQDREAVEDNLYGARDKLAVL